MKQMDNEVKEFHNHMANSMSGLMKAFNDGFSALDKAKKEEVPAEAKPEIINEVKKDEAQIEKKEEVVEKKDDATEAKDAAPETKETVVE